MQLDPANDRAARRFMLEEARDVERAAYVHGFEGGASWPLFDALQRYQNPDGGFGHALEPDLGCPQSSALATSVALQRLVAAGATAEHSLVRGAVAYLQETLDAHERVWRIVPDAAEGAPRAPWFAAEGLAERYGGFILNPKAEILAQLYQLGPAADDGWLDALAEEVVRSIEARAAAGLVAHGLIGAVQLLDAPHLSPGLRRRLFDLFAPIAETLLGRSREAWCGDGLKPLALAPHPQAALAGVLQVPLQAQLDDIIARQGVEGAWWPQRSWGEGADDSASVQSERAWAGMLTLQALRQLRAFGRFTP